MEPYRGHWTECPLHEWEWIQALMPPEGLIVVIVLEDHIWYNRKRGHHWNKTTTTWMWLDTYTHAPEGVDCCECTWSSYGWDTTRKELIVVLLARSGRQNKHDIQQPAQGRETNQRPTKRWHRSLVGSSCAVLQSTIEWRMKKYYNLSTFWYAPWLLIITLCWLMIQ